MKRDTEGFDRYLSELFEKSGYPGIAITVRGPEGVIFQKGYGYRDEKMSRPVDENTVFGIASLSKSMTALACVLLHLEGKLNLSDSVCDYFPNLHIPGIPDECVTLRDVMMHRSGMPPMAPLEWCSAMNSKKHDSRWTRYMRETAPNKMETIDQVVDYISAGEHETLGMPGEYMSYSNEGYALLSYVVDQAAGIPLEQFLQERIFRPLGMERSVMDADGSRAEKLAGGNITSLFGRDDEGNRYCDNDWSVLPPFRGSACVKSTAEDMCRYYHMLSNGGSFEGRQIVPGEAVELMIGAGFPLTEKPYYCFGLEKRLTEGRMVCEHSGGLHGISGKGSLVEGGYSTVVLCNEGDVDVEVFQWACWNYIMGLPYETTHHWAVPSGHRFSMPEALEGDYASFESLPLHCVVWTEDGMPVGTYSGVPVRYLHCKNSLFLAVDRDNPERRIAPVEFYIRDSRAWAARCGSRVFAKQD